MSSKKNQGLNERLKRKKRVQRMKTGIILFVLTWMLVCTLISVTLIAKVISLQEQIDILTENTIRSQKVEQQEAQSAGSADMKKADSGSDTRTDDGAKDGTVTDDGTDGAQKGPDLGIVERRSMNAGNPDGEEDVMRVYLTFDDGPSANTEQILDILDHYKIKATFFVTGKEDTASLQRYQEIVNRGHTIGMHSYSHKYAVVYHSLDTFAQDLDQIQTLIKKTTGVDCRLYRFPGGSSNQVSNTDMHEFIRYLNERGITYFDWNVECGDATMMDYSVDELVENVMTDVVKHHTSVVLLHDAENKPNTVTALPLIIEQIEKLDAQILPIDENTTVIQHVSAKSVEE